MNESEKIDPRELSPLALAFVGDSVLELLAVSYTHLTLPTNREV